MANQDIAHFPLLKLYDQLSDIIIVLDEENNIAAFNKAAGYFFSLPESAINGHNYFTVCQRLSLEPIADLTQPQVTTEVNAHEFINWKIIIESSHKILIGQRRSTITNSDIYLSSLLNADYNNLHIYWTDKKHQFLLFNAPVHKHLKGPTGLLGKSIIDLTKSIDLSLKAAEQIAINNEEVMALQKPIHFEEEGHSGQIYSSHKAPFYDQNGNIQGVFGISYDITEAKSSLHQLEQISHATDFYLESILMSSPSCIYWLDKDGRFIGCNDQQIKSLGLEKRTDVIGKTVIDICSMLQWSPEIVAKVHADNLAIMRSRKPFIIRERTIHNNEELYFLSSKSPLIDKNGEIVGLLGISTDITEQVRIEQELELAKKRAEASSQAKSRFIANVSHDIRTPLVGIQGIAEALIKKIPQEYQSEMHSIIKASQELLTLLNNVIRLTEFDYNDSEITPEPFDLHSLIERLMVLFSPVAQQKHIKIFFQYDTNIPHYFFSYPSLIQRAILNLIGNGLKFTEKGHVSVQVTTDPHTTATSHDTFPLLITVEDTGIGIPADKLSDIFASFYRLHPSYQGRYKGSGLGLSIAQNFVDKLKGKIWVESAEGQGSRFHISLLLPIATEIPEVKVPVDALIDSQVADEISLIDNSMGLSLKIQQEFRNHDQSSLIKRVLLIEDNPLIQAASAALLNQLHCYVDIASNAGQGVEMAKLLAYDLIFLDLGLPDHDGCWVSTQIRQSSPLNANSPIIALTAHVDPNAHQSCLDAGITRVILKPLSLDIAKMLLSSQC